MFLERGFQFTYEAVHVWEARAAPLIANQLRAERQYFRLRTMMCHRVPVGRATTGLLRSLDGVDEQPAGPDR